MRHESVRRNYDRLSRWYDWFSGSERRFAEAGLHLLDIHPGEKVLEIGFGTGHALVELARSIGERGEVYGLDLSPGMKNITERTLRHAGMDSRVTLQLGEAAELPFPDGMFQAIFMSFTLELFAEDEIPLVLAECRRVLVPGGRLGIVALAKKNSSAVRLYEWFHARLPDIVDCRPILVRHLLEAAGFEVQEAIDKSLWGLPVQTVLAVKEN